MTSLLNVGPEVLVNTTTNDQQAGPVMAALADGGYIVVWSSLNQDGSALGVYAQRYDASGNRVGVETLINTLTSGSQFDADIAALPDGGCIITWTDINGESGGGHGVYCQRFSPQGLPIGGQTHVNTTTANDQDTSRVAGLADGFVIVWESTNQDGSGNGVYMQHFNLNGGLTGSETLVNTTTLNNQQNPDIAALAGGGYVVTWEGTGQNGTLEIYMKVYDASGNAVVGETQVNTFTTSDQSYAKVAALADGGFVVTWQSVNEDGSNLGVFMQRYDATGAAAGTETQVNTYATGAQWLPSVSALDDGGYIISWSSQGQDGSGYGAYAQRYDDTGAAIGPEFRLNSYTSGDQFESSVIGLAGGGFVGAWQSANQDGSSYGVFSRRYAPASSSNGNQVLYGTSEGDDLDGGAGADTMYGGQGDDTYHVNSMGDVVSELPGQGVDTVISSISYTLGADLENLVLTGLSGINGTGNSGNNIIYGNAGANILTGNGGFDEIHGGAGNDMITAGAGNDQLYGDDGNDTINGGNGLDQIYGGNGEDTLSGQDGDDWIDGGAGNDTIGGGNGNDQLFGGDGNDELYGFNDNDQLFGGAGDDHLDGGNGDDVLNGDDGNDILSISAGTDTIHGGAGEDRLDASGWGQGVNVNLATGRVTNMAGAPGMKAYVDGVEDVTGSSYNDVIVGDAGNNIIDGGAGADIMKGGDGNDIYYVDDAGDTITESSAATGGYDEVISGVSYTLSAYIEALTLTGAAVIGNGNASDNTITGNDLANQIDGKAGNDTMIGGLGDDTYWVDNTGDAVVEYVGEGTDTVRAAISYTLGANLENLVLTGTGNINANGNDMNNVLTGNSGNNAIDGGSGADTMAGGAGDDTYYVDNAGDIVQETSGQGTDLVNSSISFSLAGQQIENLTLTGIANINATGNGLANVLTGNGGNNTLDGGYGNDTLWGLGGADTFLFNLSSGSDTVADFSAAQGDTVNIHAYTHGAANLALISQVGADIQINLGGTNIITILNTTNDATFQSHIVW